MAKIFSYVALVGSAAILLFQLFFFTNTVEQLVDSIIGLAIYVLLWFYVGGSYHASASRLILVVAAVVLLGVMPPRLRLNATFDAFILL